MFSALDFTMASSPCSSSLTYFVLSSQDSHFYCYQINAEIANCSLCQPGSTSIEVPDTETSSTSSRFQGQFAKVYTMSSLCIHQYSKLLASFMQQYIFFPSWLVWGRNQVCLSSFSTQTAHKLFKLYQQSRNQAPRAYCSNVYTQIL